MKGMANGVLPKALSKRSFVTKLAIGGEIGFPMAALNTYMYKLSLKKKEGYNFLQKLNVAWGSQNKFTPIILFRALSTNSKGTFFFFSGSAIQDGYASPLMFISTYLSILRPFFSCFQLLRIKVYPVIDRLSSRQTPKFATRNPLIESRSGLYTIPRQMVLVRYRRIRFPATQCVFLKQVINWLRQLTAKLISSLVDTFK